MELQQPKKAQHAICQDPDEDSPWLSAEGQVSATDFEARVSEVGGSRQGFISPGCGCQNRFGIPCWLELVNSPPIFRTDFSGWIESDVH